MVSSRLCLVVYCFNNHFISQGQFSPMIDGEEENEGKNANLEEKPNSDNLIKNIARDMEEIENLSRSPNKEDRLKSLELFKSKFPHLPAGKIGDYFNKMCSDSDLDVRDVAISYCESLPKRDTKSFKMMTNDINEYFNRSLRPQIEAIEKLQKSFSSSQKLARLIESNLKLSVREISHLEGLSTTMSNINASALALSSKYASVLDTLSPISSSLNYVNAITTNVDENRTLPDVLGVSEDDVRHDLDVIQKSDIDVTFNNEGYKALLTIERSLRELINEKLIENSDPKYGGDIAGEIVKRCKKRQQEEIDSKMVATSNRYIDYSDFTDLEIIFKNRRNKQVLADIMNEQECDQIASKLHELHPIRIKIAHSRLLTYRELDRIKLYSKDILKLLGEK